MSRYRAPQPPASAYITPEGRQRLQDELRFLWKTRRPEVTRAVSEAAAQGDRSENAEYIYGKKQLREIDRRVRFLRKRLEVLIVVDQKPSDCSRIYFGAWFHITNEIDEKRLYRIVGPDEFDAEKEYISMDSPLARAVMGKSEGDEVTLQTPAGVSTLIIQRVEYR